MAQSGYQFSIVSYTHISVFRSIKRSHLKDWNEDLMQKRGLLKGADQQLEGEKLTNCMVVVTNWVGSI